MIMPAWNASATISAALTSALNQSLPANEIVVVDDGSTDDTAAIVAALARGDPRVRLIRQANAGPMVARNLAIAESHGAFVAPLDADDLWHPEYLADLVGALRASRPPAGFAYALHRIIDAEGRVTRDFTDFGVQGWSHARHLLVNFVGNGSAAVFRREAVQAAGGYDPATRAWGGAEDYLLQLRVAANWPVARVPRALVGYRRTGLGYSSDADANYQARVLCVLQADAERAAPSRAVLRWALADAARVRAVPSLMARRWAAAAASGLSALWADPLATLVEIVLRCANAARRSKTAREPNSTRALFFDCDPDVMAPGPIDAVLRRRLDRLALAEGPPLAS